MSAHHQEKPKKSFEFRMSKKVAELTQVVHMLFTRNHEKEVEIEALKKSYEHEIELVLEDARSRIGKLERTVADLTTKNLQELDQVRREKISEMATKEAEWHQKMANQENLLHEEKSECQNLRDLLINAQRDIENLRQGVTDQMSSKSDEITRRDKELERLRMQLASSESQLKDAQRDAQGVITELQKTNEKLDGEVRQLHQLMDNSHKTRDQLLARNKQLENDMKTLKREFNKKVNEMVNNQLRNSKSAQSQETSEELERLRRELQRYRLELSNRDYNFNRMFTEKQPVVVNQRGSGSSSNKQTSGTLYTFSHSNGHTPQSAGPGGPISANNHGDVSTSHIQTFHKDKPQVLRNNFLDRERTMGQLDRQMTLPERISTQERLNSNNNHEPQLNNEPRPRTQRQTFMHERMFTSDRTFVRQSNPSGVHPEEPSQMLPQKSINRPPSSDRPNSSSLPSICSTPEQRRLSTQLTKPKPLSREMLYGK